MDNLERDLVRRFMNGYKLTGRTGPHIHVVLYSPRDPKAGDPLPWIAEDDPAIRFPSTSIAVHVISCIVCGTEVGNGYRYRRDFPVMDLCERDAVAELAGDLVQIEKGTMK